MNALIDRQLSNNLASRGRWELFAEHRDHVMGQLIADSAGRGGRLCLLGAGNCNDVDLRALLAHYREVHLVDLDAEALQAGAARQDAGSHPSLFLHGGVDVTAMLDTLASLSPSAAIADQHLLDAAEAPMR